MAAARENVKSMSGMAADCQLWRRSIHQATAKFKTNRLLHEAEKRQREMSQHESAGGVVVTTSVCHAGGTGSIPGTGSCDIKIWLSTLGTVYPS